MIITPSAGEVASLKRVLAPNLSLKLYSNNLTPIETTTTGSFTEVSGGGYVAKTLTFANWGFITGDPSYGLYNAVQRFLFTGTTAVPGTIYGFYVVDPNGVTLWCERFPEEVLPFSPIFNSIIDIIPRYEGS